MPTRPKRKKPRAGNKPAPRLSEAEDIALAEELIREADEQHAVFAAGFRKFLKDLGLHKKKPIGATKLRERLIREGIDPEGTEFSRGIIAMREE